MAVRDVLALLQVPVDVLDRHRGVVDQDADRQRQAAQRHDVERLADDRQRGERAQDRPAGSRSR